MTHFEFLMIALSFVLGLAVTVLLTSLIVAFRARRKSQMSWLPFAWAAYLLVIDFEVWWEIFGLASMENWSVGAFILLLLLALSLFAAGALVLPTGIGGYPEVLDQYFQEDGRWGVALIALFEVVAIVANITLMNVPVFGNMNIWNALAVVLISIVVVVSHRVVQNAVTILYGVWVGIYLWAFVPITY
jgi:hypothetical protein